VYLIKYFSADILNYFKIKFNKILTVVGLMNFNRELDNLYLYFWVVNRQHCAQRKAPVI